MKIPDTIYLQWHGDSQVPEDEMSSPHLDEVTWCSDRVYDADIEYRRVRECVWKKDWQVTSFTAAPDPIWRTACGHISTEGPIRYCPWCTGKIRVVDA